MTALDVAAPPLPGLEVPGLVFTQTGVEIVGAYEPAEVVATLLGLRSVGAAWRWIVGDLVWALAGPDKDLPAALRSLDGVDVDDQANLSRTIQLAAELPLARRRPELTWSHHFEVIALPADQQDRLLETAVVERLSVRGLRALIDQEHEDMNPRLPGVVWEPKWPSVRAIRSLLDEAGDTAWVLWQPATGEFHRAPADMIERAS